jgi:hypothetical protein
MRIYLAVLSTILTMRGVVSFDIMSPFSTLSDSANEPKDLVVDDEHDTASDPESALMQSSKGLYDTETEKYQTGGTCESRCGDACSQIRPKEDAERACGSCSAADDVCGKNGEEVCSCNPEAEDWPVGGDVPFSLPKDFKGLVCEDWCTAGCTYVPEYHLDCTKCDEDVACNPQAGDWKDIGTVVLKAQESERHGMNHPGMNHNTKACESWCTDPCSDLNLDKVPMECGGCDENKGCNPKASTWPVADYTEGGAHGEEVYWFKQSGEYRVPDSRWSSRQEQASIQVCSSVYS